jgi:hypothetical protein
MSQPTGNYSCSEEETTNEIPGVDTHEAHGGNSAENDVMTWTSQEDELASALEDCISVFRSGLRQLQDISIIKDLVFCEPLKDANSDSPVPSLQPLATANLPFLQYHDWILTLYSETQKLDCGRFKHCGRIKNRLLSDLRKEWTELEKLKYKAWQMASSPKPGSAQITNTCEHNSDCIWNYYSLITSCGNA